ncbi:S24 family peptidase, partial [Helicobacter trogontum]
MYNYETGKTPVTLEFLYKVSSVFHIDYDYLIHKPESISQSLESISEVHKSKFGVHKSSISHVPYSQNIVPKSSHSDSLVSPSQDDLSINQKSNNLVKIPVFDEVYASAGHGLINEEHISSHIELDKGFLRSYFRLTSFVDLSIIAARGDSMMPTLPENCQLLVQKGTPKEGQICVTRIDDELYVKRLQKRPKYKLISDNKSYDDIELE